MEKKSSPLSSTALINTPSNDSLEKEKNPLKRHLFKTISYRIMATSITISTALILGLDIKASALLGVGEILVKPVFYFFHERVWYNLRFKKKIKNI